jgi:pheromone shutdown protein TraB
MRSPSITFLFVVLFCRAAAFPLYRVFPSLLTRPAVLPPLAAAQLLVFREPTTNVTVKLVGSMHYNPTSIQLAEQTIECLAKDGILGSVIIESCDIRWETTTDMHPILKKLLKSEMRGACDMAIAYNRPVVLGDQRINITLDKLKAGLKETIMDLASPWNGGWPRLYANITQAAVDALPVGEAYLNPTAFFDPKLLLAAPLSLVKYPLSYLIKSPLSTIGVLMTLLLVDSFGTDSYDTIPINEITVIDWIESLTILCLEVCIFSRIFVKELLAERNVILARSILDQCKLYSSSVGITQPPSTNWWSSFLQSSKLQQQISYQYQDNEIVYVPNSIQSGVPRTISSAEESQERTVVAVLGMAHCNGIMKLLMEQRVT